MKFGCMRVGPKNSSHAVVALFDWNLKVDPLVRISLFFKETKKITRDMR